MSKTKSEAPRLAIPSLVSIDNFIRLHTQPNVPNVKLVFQKKDIGWEKVFKPKPPLVCSWNTMNSFGAEEANAKHRPSQVIGVKQVGVPMGMPQGLPPGARPVTMGMGVPNLAQEALAARTALKKTAAPVGTQPSKGVPVVAKNTAPPAFVPQVKPPIAPQAAAVVTPQAAPPTAPQATPKYSFSESEPEWKKMLIERAKRLSQ